MSHWRMMLRAVLGRIFGHFCTALVHREAVFGRNFGTDYEHATTTISKEECTAMSRPRMMLRAVLGRFFGHLCTALAHREAVFGRNFGAIFEHAKATISEERYTAMSHPRMMLRAGFGSAV